MCLQNRMLLSARVTKIIKLIFRVREIAYGFGGPSKKNMSVLINFLLQNTNLVSVLIKICPNFAVHI